jgi:sec-independent protein translocase protein TatC
VKKKSQKKAFEIETSTPVSEASEMPFMAHLEELRVRLIKIIAAIGIGFILSYAFSEQIFRLLMRPIVELFPQKGGSLHFTGLIEPFMTYLKIGVLAGFFLAVPYIFYQVWAFVSPGLYKKEKKKIIPIVALGSLFFIAGALFGYFFVFPVGFKYFLSFANEDIQPMLTITDYLSLTSKMLIGFGVVFETPLVIFFLTFSGIVSAERFLAGWRYAVISCAVVAAILTPPDVISMMMMAIPLLALYFGSVFFALLFSKKQKLAVVQEGVEEASE